MKVGIFIDSNHMAFGGPSTVLLNTIAGFKKLNHEILMDSVGDINWFTTTDPLLKYIKEHGILPPNSIAGPCIFELNDYKSDKHGALIQQTKKVKFLFASQWFYNWITQGKLNFRGFQPVVWPAGIDTDFYAPITTTATTTHTKKYDYFIYFKNRNILELKALQSYMFMNYYNLRGPVLFYHFYNPEHLKEMAQNSRFCIYMGGTETQGLASLEIMACDCPILCLEYPAYAHEDNIIPDATSITCWEENTCGKKFKIIDVSKAFPEFLADLDKYTPRKFVESKYTLEKTAQEFINIAVSS